MFATKFAVLLIALCYPYEAHAAMSGAWTPCPKGDANLADCMVKSVEKFLPALAKGLPQYNIPPLDPVMIGTVDLSTKDLKMLYSKGRMSNLLSTAKVVAVEADPDKYTLRVNILSPEVVSDGDYELNGKMLVMPVVGKGEFEITYINASLDVTFIGKAKTKDGKPHMELTDVKVIFEPSQVKVKITNLFNGNKEMSDNFHKFANENWRELFDGFKTRMWANLGGFFKHTFSKMFDDVPYNEIYTF